ncbi:hypothetical protein N7462_011292 [Penicillium macrosclerotiorum]|uniref:uncharacterized protein n=1 Tax=Penicillium macrosclerotiorum TaxID=303699 RepID=UPI002547EF19|nr:uncharacterized protein N7462_011292 [Penicillium macrosclerotiorum]KAJ5666883.1 hypothetical protein N7462_011292 [Penicillium macrosclerotiorum]
MASKPGTFHLFPRLPPELRLAIWRECLPSRVMELDDQHGVLTWDDRSPRDKECNISRINATPPVIARVCCESRAVAFECGRPQILPDETNPETCRYGNYMIEDPWLDTARDIVHLNWDLFVDIEMTSYSWGDPIRCLIWSAERTRSTQASMMLGVLQVFQGRDNPDEPHRHYRWTRSELTDLIRSKPVSWKVIVLPPVIIHADVETSAGLFGLLADARVQIVDVDDIARINKFLALGEERTASLWPKFEQEDLISGKVALAAAVEENFGSEEDAPTMRAAVMFRLCTNDHINTK